MVRFLMYSSDFDVVGIVENNSRYQNSGHSKSKWIQARIDLYAQILPNLHKHNPNFPAPDALKAAIKLGNENSADLFKAPQDMATKDTPGSLHIIATLLDKDPRVVHVPSWGGANTTAYALWKLKTEYTKEQFEYAANRIWIYGICYDLAGHAQDGGFKWIIDNIPEAKLYQATWWSRTWNYSSVGSGSSNPSEIQAYMSEAWLSENAKSGHGPLGAAIGQAYVSEGDTPSWLSLINNGLQQHVDYTLGGWGGRAVYQDGTGAKGWMIDGIEDPDDKNPATRSSRAWWRWIPAAQNDYAARMDWAVADDFKKANHNPVAKVKGDLVRSVAAGATIDLDASETTDPDGNALTFKWWQYHEADSVSAKVTISSDTAKTGARFTVPSEPGKQVQIILEVTDDGKPPLTHYQRLLFNIQ